MNSGVSKRKKALFRDTVRDSNAGGGNGSVGISFSMSSCWREQKPRMNNVKCQTSSELFEFRETETQAGLYTDIVQAQVKESESGMTLLDHFCKKHRSRTAEQWERSILDGTVTVDCEVATDPQLPVHTEYFLEYVHQKVTISTQTASTPAGTQSSAVRTTAGSGKKRDEAKGGDEDNEYADDDYEDDEAPASDAKQSLHDHDESKAHFSGDGDDKKLERFLRRAWPLLLRELEDADRSQAFALYNSIAAEDPVGAAAGGEKVTYFKLLSVDLEKKKVIYPDWSQSRHYKGVVVSRTVTRNKERIYEIEYDDGSVVSGVREEYIRVVGAPLPPQGGADGKLKSKSKNATTAPTGEGSIISPHFSLLKEGVRVHARVPVRSGPTRYYPGRITKAVRGSKTGGGDGVYDVEIEGTRVEAGLTAEDLFIGLTVGQQVEARRPAKVQLQCTGLSWNATGGVLAASYGRSDLTGWCDYPGAVCCWSIFGKSFNPNSPDFVLDHASCLMCVSYHPVNPSLVAAGSFNGEVIVWDLTQPEQPLHVSSISEYSHKEPVLDVKWVQHPSSTESDPWLLCSIGADGKILFWHSKNRFEFPVKGNTLAHRIKASSRRHYPASHGATVATFGSSGSTGGATASWMLIGQEGGTLSRGEVKRILGGQLLHKEKFRNHPSVDDVFPSLKSSGAGSGVNYQPHIGAVTGLSFSPFHKNMFLSSGADGTVKMFNLLEKQPKMMWEPRPPPGSDGVAGPFSAISAVQFSPSRPLVFGAASGDGFVYVYDLAARNGSNASPAAVLECLLNPPLSAAQGGGNSTTEGDVTNGKHKRGGRARDSSDSKTRVSVTGLAFNPKQRKFIAACDYLGRVHIWKLTWNLSTMRPEEEAQLRQMGGIGSNLTG